MDIRCECAACEAQFRIDAKYAGRKGKCPKCGEAMLVPTADTSPPSSNSAAKPPARSAAKAPAKPAAKPLAARSTKSAPPKRTDAATAGAASPFDGIAAESSGGIAVASTGGGGSIAGQRLARHGKKANNSSTLLVGALIGGGALVVIAALVGILYFAGGSGALSSADPVLVIHWSEADRGDGKILINAIEKNMPSSGEIKFELKPGEYDVVLVRRGYLQIDEKVKLNKGQSRKEIRPKWEPNRIWQLQRNAAEAAEATAGAGGGGGSGDEDDSDFAGVELGSESLETLPAGFGKGWTQNFQKAQEEAVENDKKLLMLFTGSDWCPPCKQLEKTVLHSDDFTNYVDSRFAKVVLDFPRTQEGHGRVLDTAQNSNLQGKYGVRGFPTMVLATADGKPYAFLVGVVGGNVTSYVAKLQELENTPQEMKELFAEVDAAEGDARLEAAVKGVKWLQEHSLLQFYGSKVQKFVSVAKELAPNNEQGKYEILFEADWMSRLHEAREDWGRASKIVVELEQWKGDLKFKDGDRGARLHLFAAVMYAKQQNKDGASKHVEAGLACSPTDTDTRNKLKQLEGMFSGIAGFGSGWIAGADGYIMTNNHVIAGARKVTILLPNTETEATAKIVATDAKRDMAILKIDVPEGTPWDPRPIKAQPKHGADVNVLGFPLGESGLKISDGLVMGMPLPSNDNMIETDCTVNPGNSGGPLCDTRGNVVGMVSQKSRSSEKIDSHGLALPGEDLLKFLAKHVPDYTPLPPDEAKEKLDGAEIIELVGPTVMMIRNHQ